MTSLAVRRHRGLALAAGIIVLIALVVAVARQGGGSPGSVSRACTGGLSSPSEISNAVTGARPGAAVCVRPGVYGALTLTRAPTGRDNVILEPAPASTADNRSRRVSFTGITIAGSGITVRDIYSTGGIAVTGADAHDVRIDHDDVSNPRGYGVSILCAFAHPCSHVTISGNRIHGTCATCEGDAIRLDGWRDVSVVGNDIYAIHACAGCHTDTLQSFNDQEPTTGLRVYRNYVHDTFETQGLPFLKDGDVGAVRIADNLSVRMSSNGQTNGPGIAETSSGLVITRNTYVQADGYVQASGSGSQPTARVDHNVIGAFNVQAPYYALSEANNLYTGNNEWSFRISATSRLDSHPEFLCGTHCGDGNPAGDDYRLIGYNNPKSANYDVGIDWNPASQRYGPE